MHLPIKCSHYCFQDTTGKELFNAAEQGDFELCSQLLQIGADQVDWRAGSEYVSLYINSLIYDMISSHNYI